MQSFFGFRFFMFLCLLFLCDIGFMSDGVLLTNMKENGVCFEEVLSFFLMYWIVQNS